MENEKNQDVDLENNDKELQDEVDYKALAESQAAEAAKWKAIAERNKKKAASQSNKLPTEDEPDLRQAVNELQQDKTRHQFGYRHGLTPDETDLVFQFNPKPTEETLKNPFVKGGLDRIREQARLAQNTPSNSGVRFTANGKSWADMSDEEKQANYADFVKAGTKKR